MPRLYLTPTEFNASPLGLAMAPVVSQLGTGVLDQLLARCSQRCDNYCEKRLQAGSTSTLSQAASATATSISVASTLTLDSLSEQAVIIDVGNSNQEIISIPPGGISVTSWTSPYPGIVQLAQPLQFGHVVGAPVQYVYKEVSEAIKASQSDPYSEALQSQAAQLALAHLPPMHVGLTRIAFLKQYPIQTVLTVEHSYSFDTQYNVIYDSSNSAFTGGIVVEPTAGYLRFRIGTVVTPEGMVRTTYVGGYNVIPDDIKTAVMYYMADDLAFMMNPMGATDQQMGKRRQSAQLTLGKTPNVQRAEAILRAYKRCV